MYHIITIPTLQEDIRDIVEMYDEELHGSLDTPAVRTEVHQQRQYFGPPRTTEEQAAHDHALQQARIVASQVRFLVIITFLSCPREVKSYEMVLYPQSMSLVTPDRSNRTEDRS